MEEIHKFQELSLISKVCSEIENHLGIEERDARDLAEWLIHVAKQNADFRSFSAAVARANDDEDSLPKVLLASVHRSVLALKPRAESRVGNSVPSARRPRFADAVPTASFGASSSSRPRASLGKHDFGADDNGGGFLGSGINREELIKSTIVENEALLAKSDNWSSQTSSGRYRSSGSSSAGSLPISNPQDADIRPGAILRGRVSNIRDFGAFVSLGLGTEGQKRG